MGRLQTARLENFIRRWGSIKGEGSILSETLGDVFPVLDLENLTPENQLVAGWTTFWGFLTVLGVAAQTTGLSVVNPPASGNIIVVDQVVVNRETTGNFTIGRSLPLFTTILNGRTRDSRAPQFTGAVRFGSNANTGATETGLIFRTAGLVDNVIELPHSIAVLGPGGQLAVVNSTVNDNLTCSFAGRVRALEPSEESF